MLATEVYRPEEQLTFAEALWTYTVGGALACQSEHGLGQLEAGFAADLVAVSPSVLERPWELSTIRPAMVMVGGQIMRRAFDNATSGSRSPAALHRDYRAAHPSP